MILKKIISCVLLILFLMLAACQTPSQPQAPEHTTQNEENTMYYIEPNEDITIDINQTIPATPITPIEIFGEVPEQFAGDRSQYRFEIEFTDEEQAFRRRLAEKYDVDIYYINWIGSTPWGDVVQIKREVDASGMNQTSDIIVLRGHMQGQREVLRFPFDAGQAQNAQVHGNILVIDSLYVAGRFAMHVTQSVVPSALERVVTGYNRQGEALWRGTEQLWE